MARTSDPVYAATKAGYGTPDARASELQRRPEVQAEVGRRVMHKLAALGDLAVSTVEQAMTASTSTWTNKLTAADMVLKRLEKGEGEGLKEPSEMSADEIESTIQALRIRQAAIAEGAKDITPETLEPDGVFG
jgi:hypothetical protein